LGKLTLPNELYFVHFFRRRIIMIATKRVLFVASMGFVAVVFYLWGHVDGGVGRALGLLNESFAAENTPEVSPVLARERDTYYPNTEDLAKDEMRVIACGTGMPTTRAAQAAA
jgi:ribonuclease Z